MRSRKSISVSPSNKRQGLLLVMWAEKDADVLNLIGPYAVIVALWRAQRLLTRVLMLLSVLNEFVVEKMEKFNSVGLEPSIRPFPAGRICQARSSPCPLVQA